MTFPILPSLKRWLPSGQVLLIDLVLAGDNAIAVGALAAGLPAGTAPQSDYDRDRRRISAQNILCAYRKRADEYHRFGIGGRIVALMGRMADVARIASCWEYGITGG